MQPPDAEIDQLTGLIPEGPRRAELVELLRLGVAFRAQRCGRRLGFFQRYLQDIIDRLGESVTMAGVLEELEVAAARRNLDGPTASPIEKIDRIWQIVTYHHPKRGRVQITFKTLQNKITLCKKKSPRQNPESR